MMQSVKATGAALLAVGTATLSAAPARSDAPFGARRVVSADAVDPVRAIPVDLDRDGDLDILSINNGDLSIAWHERDDAAPTGFLPRAQLFVMSATMSDVNVGDVDGDGWLDILVATNPASQYVWLRNAGGSPPVLEPPLLISTFADLPTTIDRADFDLDGDLDVITSSVADDRISWHENLGGNPPAWMSHQITFDPDGRGGIFEGAANAPFRIETNDVDRDGRPDIVISSSQDDTIQWFRNEPGAPVQFTPQLQINVFIDQAVHVTMGDIDGDGDDDAVSVSNGGATIQWHENRNAFSTQLPSGPITALFTPKWTDTGDIDNDGDVDVISVASTSGVIEWNENDGAVSPNFISRVIDDGAGGAFFTALADFDGDGDLDASAITRNDHTIAWHENHLIHRAVVLASPPALTTLGASVDAATAGDVDRDGDIDVVAASATDGAISFAPSRAAERAPGFAAALQVGSLAGASFISLDDLDRDGDPDILLASESSGAVAWLAHDGGDPPTFAPAQTLAILPGASSVAVGDIDGDGDRDIVLGSTSSGDVVALESNGASPPIFTQRTLSTTAGGSAVALADLDRDGDLDIVTAGGVDDDVRWLRNSGGGAFNDNPIASPGGSARASMRIADFDSDGDSDIVVAFEGGSQILLFRNDGAPTPAFTQSAIASGLTGAFPIEVADFDRDGDVDVVAGKSTGALWLENLGGAPPAFAMRDMPGAPQAPRGLALGDFDRDGDMDALLGAPAGASLTHLQNVGGQATISALSAAPAAMADAETAPLLRVDVSNEGRAGDASARLASLRFRLLDDAASPISQALAPFLFDSFALHVDDGDGVFNAADDAQVTSKSADTLGIVNGEFSLGTSSLVAETVVEASATRRYFLVATTAGAASQQGVPEFTAAHKAGAGNVVNDAMTLSPLLLTPGADVATAPIALGASPPCPSDIDGDGSIGPDDLLALLASFGNPFGPTDLLALLSSFGLDCP